MDKIDINNTLFQSLIKYKPQWFQNLINSKGIYIEIRKDNYIDIYYNGANIIQKLKMNSENYSGEVHYKYFLPRDKSYIKYNMSNSDITLKNKNLKLLSPDNFNLETLNIIKNNISKHYSKTSEKGIQGSFINNNDFFIDSEFAYNYNNVKLRIDLVWVDIMSKKLIFIELKTMGDARLYNNEITQQLEKYYQFSRKYELEIVAYYQKLFLIKKAIGILPKGLNSIADLSDFTLELRPLLLFGDCQKNWINNNAENINTRIKDVSCGAYYYGSPNYSCDLISKNYRNQYIF